MFRVAGLVATLLIVGSSAASAQALADVAKAEEARRKTVDKPAKVYTNGDLRSDFTRPSAAPPPPAVTGPTVSPSSTEPAAPEPTAAPAPVPATASGQRDEKYWKGRIIAAKDELDRSRTFLDALQSRINALTTDVVNRDDPYQRAVLEKDRLKALAELDRVKKDIESGTKAIAAIEEEARKAGAPPGWLR